MALFDLDVYEKSKITTDIILVGTKNGKMTPMHKKEFLEAQNKKIEELENKIALLEKREAEFESRLNKKIKDFVRTFIGEKNEEN